jgi:hypothetical protein
MCRSGAAITYIFFLKMLASRAPGEYNTRHILPRSLVVVAGPAQPQTRQPGAVADGRWIVTLLWRWKGPIRMDWWYFVLMGVLLVALVGFLIFRLMKKPED